MEHNQEEINDKQSKEVSLKQEANESSSYKEYIRAKIKDKADKFQEQLLTIEQKAVDFLNNVYKIVQKNHHIREYLKSIKNYYMNYLFNYFGYRYESIIENPNFFHFISQAWLVNAFEQIKEKSVSENENYSSVLEKLFNVDVKKNKLISSLELITETIYVSDPAIKLTELTLGKNFLKHIETVLNERKKQYTRTKLSKTDFGVIIMEILSKTVNLIINEIDSPDNELNNLIFYDTYKEMIASNHMLSLEEFTSKVEEKRLTKNDTDSNDIILSNACEAFYYFTQSSLSNLIIDLEMFNQQYTSFNSKIRIILNKKGVSIKDYIFKLTSDAKQFYFYLKGNIKLQKLTEFYKNANNRLSIVNESSEKLVVSKYNCYRQWINSTKLNEVLFYPRFVLEKVKNLSGNSRVIIYEKIYQPIKDISILVSENSLKFVVRNVENVQATSLAVYTSIRENTLKLWESKFKQEYIDQYIKIHLDDENNTIVIDISKKVFALDSSKLMDLYSYIFKRLKSIKISDNLHEFYEKSIETSKQIKENVIEKYRSFFCPKK